MANATLLMPDRQAVSAGAGERRAATGLPVDLGTVRCPRACWRVMNGGTHARNFQLRSAARTPRPAGPHTPFAQEQRFASGAHWTQIEQGMRVETFTVQMADRA